MRITIETPQRTFVTDPKHWLGRSLYFENLLSEKWANDQENGSYFVETDADIFEHVLRYLRTGVLPVFYDRVTGHDFPLYHALLGESMYFMVERLQKWLRQQKYLDAVKIRYIVTESQHRGEYKRTVTKGPNGQKRMVDDRLLEFSTSSDTETTITPITQSGNVFYCPNGKHGESDESYCRGCISQARETGTDVNGGWREEDNLTWCIVRKEVVFDHDLCVNAFPEEDGQ